MATINRDFFITQFKEEVDDHVHRMTQKLFQLEGAARRLWTVDRRNFSALLTH